MCNSSHGIKWTSSDITPDRHSTTDTTRLSKCALALTVKTKHSLSIIDYLFLYLFISVDTVESVCEYDITNIKHSHGTNTCMAQLPGKCENILTRPSCLDGSSSGVESEINKRE